MQDTGCLPATCPPLPETCPPLPNMLAFDLPGVPGEGRRVPAHKLNAVSGVGRRVARLRPARHCHGCVRFRADDKQAMAGGRCGRASRRACLGVGSISHLRFPLSPYFFTSVPTFHPHFKQRPHISKIVAYPG